MLLFSLALQLLFPLYPFSLFKLKISKGCFFLDTILAHFILDQEQFEKLRLKLNFLFFSISTRVFLLFALLLLISLVDNCLTLLICFRVIFLIWLAAGDGVENEALARTDRFSTVT